MSVNWLAGSHKYNHMSLYQAAVLRLIIRAYIYCSSTNERHIAIIFMLEVDCYICYQMLQSLTLNQFVVAFMSNHGCTTPSFVIRFNLACQGLYAAE